MNHNHIWQHVQILDCVEREQVPEPLSGTTVFCDQHDVNKFIAYDEGVSSRISSIRTK